MTPLDTLAPDQRAVLELVLRQGRSYGELSELLGIPERDVRARADAGLRVLAGDAAAGVDTGRISDWLLGQQPEAEADRTRAAVERSADARAWAATAAERVRELGGGAVPEVPAGEISAGGEPPRPRPRPLRDAEPPPARPRPLRESAPSAEGPVARSSRLGGAILIGVLVLVVGGLIAFVVLRGGDDDNGGQQAAAQPEATATPTPTATANANDIVLRGNNGSNAVGVMRLIRRDNGDVQFAIAAENVPANKNQEVYAVWFTREGGKPRRLGFTQAPVKSDGILTTGGPQQGDEDEFPKWFATYDKVLITRETDAKAKTPGPAVLEGALPSGS
ncbi:MAG TPA: sigma factor-like helix-turn-helix DNA-binding protein [Solirubrobacteraceae bacterium]|nr:sigma factor-like helix-turn-helix DNA-binding protein [Solirubrobacteraceae bacterium]